MTSRHEQQDRSETQPLLAQPSGVNEHTDSRTPWHDGPAPNGSLGTVGVDDEGGTKAENNVSSARARLKFIFPALAIGIFLAAGDQTIIVSSYGRIGSDLDELDKTAWLATAYLCTTTAFQPLYGKLGDIFGRKACLLFAYSVFGLGALLCGLAGNMTQLIVARALTGIGAGGIITVVSILLSDIVTLEERGIWQGYVNMVFACGAGLGAPLGGILTDAIGWRWAFIGQGPLCAIAILLVAVLLQLPPPPPPPPPSKLAQVDFLGATTLITALTTLLLYLDRLATPNNSTPTTPQHEWTTHLYLLTSIIALLFFLHTEHTLSPHPLTPLHLLFGRPLLGAYLALAFGNVAWYGVLFYVPLLYQATAGHISASAAGALLLPGIASGVVGGFVGGAVLRRKGGKGFRGLALAAYPLVGMACVGVAVGAGVMFWAGSGSEGGLLSVAGVVWEMSGSLFVGGLGNGAGMTATLIAVVAVASPEDQAVVTACVYLYRQLGATVGLAVISLVFRRVLAAALVRRLGGADVDEVVRRVLESLDYLQHLPAETRVVVEQAYGEACRAALLLCAGLAVCAIVCSCFIKEKRQSGRGVVLPIPPVE
ncbi:major facilitator superfamily protein [Chaetomium sp. MPI-CAGE-AT-0009]|nr:major facilitator superfamily protein [Chaetomium sp. MPI-CAGE-AT-0009]